MADEVIKPTASDSDVPATIGKPATKAAAPVAKPVTSVKAALTEKYDGDLRSKRFTTVNPSLTKPDTLKEQQRAVRLNRFSRRDWQKQANALK